MLGFTNFEQIATIQAIGVATQSLLEIPSGALSDLIGKKKTLLIGFLLMGVGEIIMIIHPSFLVFLISFIIMSAGYSFYSGTMDAFIYDTLVSANRTDRYSHVLSHVSIVGSFALAFASFIGGFMPKVWVGLPFLMAGIMKLVGIIVVSLTDEPSVDTDKFSIGNFMRQTKKGFFQLFGKKMLQVTLLLVSFGIFYTVAYEILDDTSVVSYGYNESKIGILYSVVILISIPAGFLYEKFAKRFNSFILIALGAMFLVLNYIFSPWIGVSIWTVLFISRAIYSPIRNSAISEVINRNTPSKIRATTISTYELVRKIPYMLLAAIMGGLMDKFGVHWFAFGFGLSLFLIITPQILLFMRRRKFRN